VSQSGTQGIPVARGLTRHRVLAPTRPREMRGEILACAVGFGLLAVLMCAAHVRHGGFYYDDWSLVALGRFPGAGGLVHSLWLGYGQRPGQVLYYAALDEAFGAAAWPRLALAGAMIVLQATCLYALLRCLAMRARDAAVIAALALAFPFSDSVWLWGVLSLTSLAISAALLGVILALRALQGTGRRAFALHAASLSLYVASILSYEAFAVAGCLAGLLYAHAVGLRRARLRWVLDVLVIGVTLAFARFALPIDVATPSRTQSLAGMIHHAGLILARGARLTGAAALPLTGLSPWFGAGAIAAVLAAGALVSLRLPSGDVARAELGRWLALAGAGAVGALAAWAVYVPATDHYLPSLAGTVDRVNAAAAIGIAALLYSCIVLSGRMLVRLTRLPASGGAVLVGAAALALGGGYLARSLADARAWDAAAADQRMVLSGMHAALPRLPGEATVYVYGAPATVGPGIPVLNTTLDLTSAMRVSYSSPKLLGVPIAAAANVICARRGVLAAGVSGAYGRSYLFDVATGGAASARGRRRATAQIGVFCLEGIQRHERGVGHPLGALDRMPAAPGEGGADDHAVADDERGQLATFDVGERGADAHLLFGEGLPAGKREARIARGERDEQLGRHGLDLGEAAVRPVARVGLHQACVLDGLQADRLRHDVGRFARAQQWAGRQRGESVCRRPLGQVDGLRATRLVERNRELALEASLEVVGGLAVAGQVDAVPHSGAQAGGPLGQGRSNRSRFMTLFHTATKSRTNFSLASSDA
jgi:hypothetical protein